MEITTRTPLPPLPLLPQPPQRPPLLLLRQLPQPRLLLLEVEGTAVTEAKQLPSPLLLLHQAWQPLLRPLLRVVTPTREVAIAPTMARTTGVAKLALLRHPALLAKLLRPPRPRKVAQLPHRLVREVPTVVANNGEATQEDGLVNIRRVDAFFLNPRAWGFFEGGSTQD